VAASAGGPLGYLGSWPSHRLIGLISVCGSSRLSWAPVPLCVWQECPVRRRIGRRVAAVRAACCLPGRQDATSTGSTACVCSGERSSRIISHAAWSHSGFPKTRCAISPMTSRFRTLAMELQDGRKARGDAQDRSIPYTPTALSLMTVRYRYGGDRVARARESQKTTNPPLLTNLQDAVKPYTISMQYGCNTGNTAPCQVCCACPKSGATAANRGTSTLRARARERVRVREDQAGKAIPEQYTLHPMRNARRTETLRSHPTQLSMTHHCINDHLQKNILIALPGCAVCAGSYTNNVTNGNPTPIPPRCDKEVVVR
jgi:hypothetical protein